MMDTGCFTDSDGSWYYLNKEEGRNIGTMQTGWMTDSYDGYRCMSEELSEISDIDFRIDKGSIRGLFQLCGFKNRLEDLLGRNVDVLTTQSLDQNFLDRIAKEEILLYANQ